MIESKTGSAEFTTFTKTENVDSRRYRWETFSLVCRDKGKANNNRLVYRDQGESKAKSGHIPHDQQKVIIVQPTPEATRSSRQNTGEQVQRHRRGRVQPR
jgi:hypothetical protein